MQAECLRSQIAPLAARYRSCSSNRQRTSAAQCLGSQFAPPGSSLSLVLIKPPAHVRGGCTPGNSRQRTAAKRRVCANRQRTSAAQCLGSQFAPWQLAIARAHRTASARPRPSAWALKSRQWQLAIARAHREASTRPRPSARALNSRPWQLAAARAHRTASARARRGLCMELSPSPHPIFYKACLRFL